MLSRFNEASKLCDTVLTLDALHACFYSRLAKKAFLTGCYIKFFMTLRIPLIGQKIILFVNHSIFI